jgi:hypothetical protein
MRVPIANRLRVRALAKEVVVCQGDIRYRVGCQERVRRSSAHCHVSIHIADVFHDPALQGLDLVNRLQRLVALHGLANLGDVLDERCHARDASIATDTLGEELVAFVEGCLDLMGSCGALIAEVLQDAVLEGLDLLDWVPCLVLQHLISYFRYGMQEL